MPGPEADDSAALESARPLTRRDVARLHRHKLDPAMVQAWMERARRLDAPWAPPGVELVPNHTGWLLGVGSVLSQRTRRLSAFTGSLFGYLAATSAMNLIYGLHFHTVGLLVATASTGLMTAMLSLGPGRSFRRARRLLVASEPVHALDGVPPGRPVRLTGVVAEQPTVPALFSGRPAVLFRNRIEDADEVRGIDFTLVLDSGQSVKVRVFDALLLDRPRRIRAPAACGPVSVQQSDGSKPMRLQSDVTASPPLRYRVQEPRRYESSIGPGDRVEVWGLLKQETAPDGQAAPGRGVPMRTTVSAGPDLHLLVRKLASPAQ
jgi:hypothetical protein